MKEAKNDHHESKKDASDVGWNEIFHGCIVVVLQQLTKQLAHSQTKT